MPNDWRQSRMEPIFKGKGDALECNNYRVMKLLSHAMKLFDKKTEARLIEITNISEN